MDLAIGEYFESIIKSLKSSLGGFFNTVSEVLNFAISILENILILDHELIYPSLILAIVIAGLGFYFFNKKFKRKSATILAILVCCLFGGIELWRAELLNTTVSQNNATETILQLEDYNSRLKTLPQGEHPKLIESVIVQNNKLKKRFQRIKSPKIKTEIINQRSYQLLHDSLEEVELTLQTSQTDSALELLEQTQKLKQYIESCNPTKLSWYPWLIMTSILSLLAYIITGRGLTILSIVGFTLIMLMNLWQPTMETLALVLSATCFALLIGVPLGILSAGNKTIDAIVKPILDFMQTMPAFVYLIPAVIFFGLGKVPGAMATLIFAMPPAVRLTSLGIRSVPKEVVEAAQAFGATPLQLLFKAQLPIALPTILAGLNQTIMLSLSMVVIGGMIGAGGLGEVVLTGITQLKIGLGFESGLAVVILAIYLDRLTQALGSYKK